MSEKTPDKKYVIYLHKNKINNKVYVGQTCQKPENRWSNGKGYKQNVYFTNAINKYGWDNFEHIILKVDLTLEEANVWEEFYIKKYKSTDRKYGYNQRFGGKNSEYSEQAKAKISQNHANVNGKNNPFYNKHHSQKLKNYLSKKFKGRKSYIKGLKMSEDAKQKMRDNHCDYKGKNNPRARKINQYDLDGNYIKSYWGCMEVKELYGFDNSGIAKCCKGKVKTSYGYIWRYADE